MPDPHGALEAGQPMYSNGFLPAVYQPTMLGGGPRPIRNLDLPPGVTPAERQQDGRADPRPERGERRRRTTSSPPASASYDLAFRMQTEAPEVFDLTKRDEGDARPVRRRHGADRRLRPALPARPPAGREGRAVRGRGVAAAGRATCSGTPTRTSRRTTSGWPAQTDKPVAGLLTDLKRRGLLDSTLVLWGGEFGRSPEAQDGAGRDHHNLGFTMWLAGGGIKGGRVGRRDGRHRAAGGRGPVPRPRRPHHDPAPTRARPGEADVPAPRPPRAAHAGRGEGHQADRVTGGSSRVAPRRASRSDATTSARRPHPLISRRWPTTRRFTDGP